MVIFYFINININRNTCPSTAEGNVNKEKKIIKKKYFRYYIYLTMHLISSFCLIRKQSHKNHLLALSLKQLHL